jgi:hypothetical protein
MPHGISPIMIDYKETLTLQEVLDIVLQNSATKDTPLNAATAKEYHFLHVEAPLTTPPLKFDTKLGSLNSVSVKLVKPGEDSNASLSPSSSTNNTTSTIQNTEANNDVKSVEDLLK